MVRLRTRTRNVLITPPSNAQKENDVGLYYATSFLFPGSEVHIVPQKFKIPLYLTRCILYIIALYVLGLFEGAIDSKFSLSTDAAAIRTKAIKNAANCSHLMLCVLFKFELFELYISSKTLSENANNKFDFLQKRLFLLIPMFVAANLYILKQSQGLHLSYTIIAGIFNLGPLYYFFFVLFDDFRVESIIKDSGVNIDGRFFRNSFSQASSLPKISRFFIVLMISGRLLLLSLVADGKWKCYTPRVQLFDSFTPYNPHILSASEFIVDAPWDTSTWSIWDAIMNLDISRSYRLEQLVLANGHILSLTNDVVIQPCFNSTVFWDVMAVFLYTLILQCTIFYDMRRTFVLPCRSGVYTTYIVLNLLKFVFQMAEIIYILRFLIGFTWSSEFLWVASILVDKVRFLRKWLPFSIASSVNSGIMAIICNVVLTVIYFAMRSETAHAPAQFLHIKTLWDIVTIEA